MRADEFVAIFDIGVEPYTGWVGTLFVLAFAIVGGTIFGCAETKSVRAVGAGLAAFSILVALLQFALTLYQYDRLRVLYQRGIYDVVEGQVEDFQADSPSGKGPQIFVVDDHRFSVRSNQLTSAFHRTVGAGGPNLAGQCVRIAYTDDDEILWLGVKPRGTCP